MPNMKIKQILVVIFISIASITLCAFLFFSGSLPHLDGDHKLLGLQEQVTIKRDDLGIPTLEGNSREDIARATGFIHAQERFFQMDLMRRLAAGELSELFGKSTIEFDKERRIHCFRNHSKKIWKTLSSSEKQLLEAYTQGVNAGISSLRCRPFEYYLLREKPKPWSVEDSILVGLSLFFDLQDPLGSVNWTRGILQNTLDNSVFSFLTANGSAWESTMDQSTQKILPIPSQEAFSYLTDKPNLIINESNPPLSKGSNQWAIAPCLSTTGKSILACDMHLNLIAPNIWYRLGIKYKDKANTDVEVHGVSLPGTPLIAVGSNRHIAWGFTNGYVETTDLILLETEKQDTHYLTPKGLLPFDEVEETIYVKNAAPISYKIDRTIWGPVHPKRFFNKKVAILWVAHFPDCFNFRLKDLENTTTSAQALATLPSIHLPVLNFTVSDREGNIGWSYVGKIPKRVGYDPGLPISFADGKNFWDGFIKSEEYPKIFNPSTGAIWTANNRVFGEKSLGRNYLNPIRAFQIEQRLKDKAQHSINDLYEIQLDDEAIFFNRWHELLVTHLEKYGLQDSFLYHEVIAWDKHCCASSQGYFAIRDFRRRLIDKIATKVLEPCLSIDSSLDISLLDLEEPFYLIASQQPSYLYSSNESWDTEILGIIDSLVKDLKSRPKRAWGVHNIATIEHPLSRSISFFGRFLNMPKQPQSGDYFVPRVSSPTDGASVRLVVSPGFEEEGILSVPCGQSGHPLSKHYRDQHKAWSSGKPTTFLPGITCHSLALKPILD